VVDTDFHPIAAAGRRYNNRPEDIGCAPVRIGRNVFLGTGSVVLKGVTIGDNAVVGAGAVVVSDVPADAIVAGNPARVIGQIPQAVSRASS
jgi:acetyltransferase-like isoleucine patch superfamily enzyme